MGFFSKIMKFASGGSLDETEPEVEKTSPEVESGENEIDPNKLGSNISDAYLSFLDNTNKELYLSDLMIFRAKKERMKKYSFNMKIPDENSEAIILADKAGFYEELKRKPYYDQLPFKNNLLNWLPDVETLNNLKIDLKLNSPISQGTDVNDVSGSANISAGFDINDTTSLSGNVKLSRGKDKKFKPSANIKLTKTF